MQNGDATGALLLERATIRSLAAWGAAALTSAGFDEARLHAELLLGHALKLNRSDLEIHGDRLIDRDGMKRFHSLLSRRLRSEPLQYIVGETAFMGLEISVDPRVLIPRPETELLAEKTLEVISRSAYPAVRILDIGTGSGCVAIALAHRLPHSQVTGLDVSAEALQVAARNVERHGLRNVTLIEGDIFEHVLPDRTFEIIVANPPYIPAEDFPNLQPEVRDFEPRIATTDDQDGLRFARRIAAVASRRLTGGGALLMEIGYGQAESAAKIFRGEGLSDITVWDDYAKIPRVVAGMNPGTDRVRG